MGRAIAIMACALALGGAANMAAAEVVISSSNAPDRLLSTNELAGDAARDAAGTPAVDLAEVHPKPRSAIRYDRAWLEDQPEAKGDAEWQCLSEALYFEARGESVRGLFAVAEVILNRRDSKTFPDTVCGVVGQGTGKRYQCQFSYNCDGAAETIGNPRAFRKVGKVARLMLDGAPRRLTDGATHYHTKAVEPAWSRTFARTSTIGMHYFYRMSS